MEYNNIISECGNTYWLNAKRQYHRLNGPAVVMANGDKYWWKNNKQHRDNGPAVECLDGIKAWYKNGKLHREDGPAFESSNGYKAWHKYNKLHREDGPAIEWVNGRKEWYLNGKKYTEYEFNAKMNPSKVIEMTMTEINKMAGCKVKIVKKH